MTNRSVVSRSRVLVYRIRAFFSNKRAREVTPPLGVLLVADGSLTPLPLPSGLVDEIASPPEEITLPQVVLSVASEIAMPSPPLTSVTEEILSPPELSLSVAERGTVSLPMEPIHIFERLISSYILIAPYIDSIPAPSPDDTITLHSADEIPHIACLSTLTLYSSCFKDMIEVSPPSGSNQSPSSPIILPNASSPGLALVLAVLDLHHTIVWASRGFEYNVNLAPWPVRKSPLRSSFEPISPDEFHKIQLSSIGEALDIARTYDISLFDYKFMRILPQLLEYRNPSLAYACLAIHQPDVIYGEIDTAAVKVVSTGVYILPRDIACVLARVNRTALLRYTNFANRHIRAHYELIMRLSAINHDLAGFESCLEKYLSRSERKRDRKRVRVCRARMEKRDWDALRDGVLDTLPDKILSLYLPGSAILDDYIVEFIQKGSSINCERCLDRIADPVWDAVCDYNDTLNNWD